MLKIITLPGPVTDIEVTRKDVQRSRRGALEDGVELSFFFNCLSLARFTAPLVLAYLEAVILAGS